VKLILPVEKFRTYFTTKKSIIPVELMMNLTGMYRMNVTSDLFTDVTRYSPPGAAILAAALASADPQQAVARGLSGLNQKFDLSRYTKIGLVSMGKAALPMALSAVRILGTRIAAGIVVGKVLPENANRQLSAMKVLRSNHPVPGQASIQAAEEILHYVDGFDSNDAVLFLISGGASALVTLPAAGISLEQMQSVTSSLLACGASINEINAVRKHLDRIKGGQLAARTAPAASLSLILSDVLGNPLDVIASGPTVPDPTTFRDALSVLEKYDLAAKLPESVLDHLRQGEKGAIAETPKPGDSLFQKNHTEIIGSLEQSMQAAHHEAGRLGYTSEVLSPLVTGEAREQGKRLGKFLRVKALEQKPGESKRCWIAGGETTVTLTGDGAGGRNQELALAAALELDGMAGVTLITFATDGEDGRSPAAGAVVTGKTCETARQSGLNAHEFLAGHNSYLFFKAVDSAIITGSTGTNVNDLVVMLAG